MKAILLEQQKNFSSGDVFLVKAAIGTIVIWSGTKDNIPSGWQLCDGTNGTPDLRDKFVLGAGEEFAVGNAGGEKEHTLTPNETASKSVNAVVSGSEYINTAGMDGLSASKKSLTEFTHYNMTKSKNANEAHNNMPPYYALCYIMKVSLDSSIDGITQEELENALTAKQDAFEIDSSLEFVESDDSTKHMGVKTPVQSILTQSEYDALSEEEQNKGLYIIDDGVNNSFSELNYSTEEQRVGRWIDEKPIYKRSVSLSNVTIPSSTRKVIDFPDWTSIDTLVKNEVACFREGRTMNDEFDVSLITYGENRGITVLPKASTGLYDHFTVTLYYTKTTDSGIVE